jgi:predicted nuclease with RNAse H fold
VGWRQCEQSIREHTSAVLPTQQHGMRMDARRMAGWLLVVQPDRR